jgi:manganese transport protein
VAAATPAIDGAGHAVGVGRAGRFGGPPALAFWRKLLAFSGPGYLVAVGYMDPGNWATGIAAGSEFGYRLLFVVLASNLLALLLQSLSARLGIVTGVDLARACGQRYRAPTRIFLWLICEAAIIACDLAEVIGAAVALKLLFGIPLVAGVCMTGVQTLLILALQGRGARRLEAIVISLMAVIAGSFAVELALSQPSLAAIGGGLVPSGDVVSNPAMLYLAIGILGATVMPHNLYLHSAMVLGRKHDRSEAGIREEIRFSLIDLTIALSLAVFVNGAILVLAASTFHANGMTQVTGLEDAHRLLSPLLGAGAASTLFAVALLASGQNSAITGTLAGQIVMEGFTDFKWPVWMRRVVSRALAITPAVFVVSAYGEGAAMKLLIFSQVVLSLQLPFAVVPLIRLTNSTETMGAFANPPWVKAAAWASALLIIGLNTTLLLQMI